MKYSNSINYYETRYCDIHQRPLTKTIVCGIEIPVCEMCIKLSDKSGSVARARIRRRSFYKNRMIEKNLGKSSTHEAVTLISKRHYTVKVHHEKEK